MTAAGLPRLLIIKASPGIKKLLRAVTVRA